MQIIHRPYNLIYWRRYTGSYTKLLEFICKHYWTNLSNWFLKQFEGIFWQIFILESSWRVLCKLIVTSSFEKKTAIENQIEIGYNSLEWCLMTSDLRKSLRHEAVQHWSGWNFCDSTFQKIFTQRHFREDQLTIRDSSFFNPGIIFLKSEMHTSVKTNPVYFVMIKLILEATAP